MCVALIFCKYTEQNFYGSSSQATHRTALSMRESGRGLGSGLGLDSLENSDIYILVKLLKTEADPAIWQKEDPIDENQEL